VYCKAKPSDWSLRWAGDDSKLLKPAGLLSDEFENNAGCVEPVLERKYCEVLGVKPWASIQLVKSSIGQLEYLSGLVVAETRQYDKIDSMFKEFVKLMVKSKVGAEVCKLLPSKWVYCRRENEEGAFLGVESLALKVENPVFPEMYVRYVC
jgi:hypothetical protein